MNFDGVTELYFALAAICAVIGMCRGELKRDLPPGGEEKAK
jgi:hypothetical protein